MPSRSTVSHRRTTLMASAVAVIAAALTGTAVTAAAPSAAAQTTRTPGASTPATSTSGSGFTPAIGAHPRYVRAGKPAVHGDQQVLFSCQLPTATLRCYGPDQIRNAYDIQPLLDKGVTGKGRTIVIVDAFNPPNVQAELDTFTTTWHLPKARLRVVNPYGAGYDESDPNQQGWAGEIALDTQWAHVVAPDAKIVLVTAKTNDDADLQDAIDYAVDHHLGDVVSQSFGEDERCFAKNLLARSIRTYARGTAKGITFTASSGDQGSAQPTCDGNSFSLAASTPANNPLNLAVGGTKLTADPTTGAYESETTWNESVEFGLAGGGGFSTIFAKPWYQYGVVPGKYRGEPDVAYSAAFDGSVLIYFDPTPSSPGDDAGFYIVAGTSAGAPQWAALIALGAQLAHHSLGLVNDSIYVAARVRRVQDYLFHDITTGNNAFTFTDANGNLVRIPGYSAKRGWDAATGWGTPRANHVVPFLAATNR